MIIKLEMNSSQAIYDQVVQQIKFAIAAGAIRANEHIPSVRELSRELAINPNTVARAYRVLQDQEIVYSKRGLGLVVSEKAQERCVQERISVFQTRFEQLYEEALHSRLSREEIESILKSLGKQNKVCDRQEKGTGE